MRLQADRVKRPVEFIAPSDEPAVAHSALNSGGLRVWHKPFSSHELRARIEFALQTVSQPEP